MSRYKRFAGVDLAWKWIRDFPLKQGSGAYDRWSGYFEDIDKDPFNVNQYLPTMTSYYILTRPNPNEVDPEWVAHVGRILDWIRQKFGRGPFFGAWGIDEQQWSDGHYCCSRAGEISDTSRGAAVNALYREKTGDGQSGEDAFRSLNYSTYFAASDAKSTAAGTAGIGGTMAIAIQSAALCGRCQN